MDALINKIFILQVISHIHYFPIEWQGQSHTYPVMTELGLLFPYTAIYLLEELLSPIITPVILIFHLRFKAQVRNLFQMRYINIKRKWNALAHNSSNLKHR